ncbi:hypothetical protein TKK_0017697 [Trichogramma kaykai]|uniref:Uncharacterized protein n=1 Tax=Trichogramma kaykai TaxID=54128 RepID=A0ABD2W2I7_9HYME
MRFSTPHVSLKEPPGTKNHPVYPTPSKANTRDNNKRHASTLTLVKSGSLNKDIKTATEDVVEQQHQLTIKHEQPIQQQLQSIRKYQNEFRKCEDEEKQRQAYTNRSLCTSSQKLQKLESHAMTPVGQENLVYA